MDKKDFFEDVNKENKKIASLIKEESDKTIIPDKMNSEELNGLLNKSNERKKQGKILKIGTIAACLALIVGVFNVTYNYITNDNNSGTFNVVVNEKNNESKSDNNESYSDIYDKLKNLQIANNAIYYGMKERNGLKTAKSESTNVADSSASSQSKSYNTNVQTQGVDEADIRKIISDRTDYPGVEIDGLQFYSGTQKKDLSQMKTELEHLDEFIGELKSESGFEAQVLEYGPGFFVPYFKKDKSEDVENILLKLIQNADYDIERAQREYDLNKAAELKYGKLPQLQKQLEEEEKIAAAKKEDSLLRDRVTDEEIARIVARWTGIPVEKLVEGEREKLLHLDDVLHQRVIGQDEAVTKVSEAILRSRAGIANPNRPIGSFLFLGPTGVGKTELAKALAQALFDDERNMVRIDMTEYMEKFSVSRLIGAPPGYVGYEEGGQLTEAVRRKPYSVVLFDEVEKAHPDVFNILLQVLDDGRITDSQGRTVDFKNTVIILTSNLGSDIILNDLEQRRANGSNELSEEAKHQIDQLLKSKFRPEFLNRLDEIVYYKSLTKDEMRRIVDLQLQDLRKRMDEGKHLKLEVTTAAKDFIIDSAYDSVYGARPIKRFIQSRVETLIAKAIIQGSYTEGNTLTVDCENGALTLR